MQNVTRRGFLRSSSVGVAAIGVLGALPTLAFADSQSGSAPASQPLFGSTTPAPLPAFGQVVSTGSMVVYISDPTSGQGVIFVGEQEFPFNSSALVQSIQQAQASA